MPLGIYSSSLLKFSNVLLNVAVLLFYCITVLLL